MGYATLRQAHEFIQSGYGECNPEKLTKAVNKIRNHFYNWYDKMALFLDATECFRVKEFCLDCNDCNDTYQGVTLPRDFLNVEAMWWNDYPIRLQSDWREYQVGISPECDCRLQKIDMPGTYSTIADLRKPSRLTFRSFNKEDAGKRLVINGTVAGAPVKVELQLGLLPQTTELEFDSINKAGGIIKDMTAGRVVIAAEDGRVLGIYEPDETVPTYKRIKITGLPHGCEAVNIRAARRYYPVFGNDDLVETDNGVAWDSMARYLRLYEKSDKTRDDLSTEKDHYLTAFNMMMGEKSRDRGKATQAEVTIATPNFGARQLSRFRARW